MYVSDELGCLPVPKARISFLPGVGPRSFPLALVSHRAGTLLRHCFLGGGSPFARNQFDGSSGEHQSCSESCLLLKIRNGSHLQDFLSSRICHRLRDSFSQSPWYFSIHSALTVIVEIFK